MNPGGEEFISQLAVWARPGLGGHTGGGFPTAGGRGQLVLMWRWDSGPAGSSSVSGLGGGSPCRLQVLLRALR